MLTRSESASQSEDPNLKRSASDTYDPQKVIDQQTVLSRVLLKIKDRESKTIAIDQGNATQLLASLDPSSTNSNLSYKIESGDTLARIAEKKVTTVAALLELNPKLKKNPNLIITGDTLVLPNTKATESLQARTYEPELGANPNGELGTGISKLGSVDGTASSNIAGLDFTKERLNRIGNGYPGNNPDYLATKIPTFPMQPNNLTTEPQTWKSGSGAVLMSDYGPVTTQFANEGKQETNIPTVSKNPDSYSRTPAEIKQTTELLTKSQKDIEGIPGFIVIGDTIQIPGGENKSFRPDKTCVGISVIPSTNTSPQTINFTNSNGQDDKIRIDGKTGDIWVKKGDAIEETKIGKLPSSTSTVDTVGGFPTFNEVKNARIAEETENDSIGYTDFKEGKNLTEEQKKTLSTKLINRAKSQQQYYNADLYIDAVKLDPNKLDVAKKYMLEFVSNYGWSNDVFSNLRKLDIDGDRAKKLIQDETNNILKEYKKDDIRSGINIEAAIVACKSAGIDLTEVKNKVTQMKEGGDDRYRDLEFVLQYGKRNATTSNQFITQFVSDDKKTLIQFYDATNNKELEIPVNLDSNGLIKWEKEQFDKYSEKMKQFHNNKLDTHPSPTAFA